MSTGKTQSKKWVNCKNLTPSPRRIPFENNGIPATSKSRRGLFERIPDFCMSRKRRPNHQEIVLLSYRCAIGYYVFDKRRIQAADILWRKREQYKIFWNKTFLIGLKVDCTRGKCALFLHTQKVFPFISLASNDRCRALLPSVWSRESQCAKLHMVKQIHWEKGHIIGDPWPIHTRTHTHYAHTHTAQT